MRIYYDTDGTSQALYIGDRARAIIQGEIKNLRQQSLHISPHLYMLIRSSCT